MQESPIHILEETARHEIREETGVEVNPQLTYLWSSTFACRQRLAGSGCGFPMLRYQSGEPAALQPEENLCSALDDC